MIVKKYRQYCWSFVIALASVRGVFVYHFGLSSHIVYGISSMLLISFGLFSFRAMFISNGYKPLVLLSNAVKINVLLIGFYMIISIIFTGPNKFNMVYLFAVFSIIFSLIKYDRKLLDFVVYAITLVTVWGVLYFYKIGIDGGFDAIAEANLILRPDKLIYSRIGENLLPAGYQGMHHDAANILVMCAGFFLAKLALSNGFRKYCHLIIYSLLVFATILTGSVANIVVLCAVSIITFFFYAKENPSKSSIIIFFALLISPKVLEYLSDYTYFVVKLIDDQSALEGGGIFNSLDINSIFESLPAIFIGLGGILNAPMIYSEVAFIKILLSVGFVSFFILMFILFSPVYYIYSLKRSVKLLNNKIRESEKIHSNSKLIYAIQKHQYKLTISAMPVLAGTLTLLHYGSLFKISSIGLFCVLISIFCKEYLAAKDLISAKI